MSDGFFAGQGLIMTIFGGGQLTIFYFLAKSLTAMFPAWSAVIYGVAALLGLEAALMLLIGLGLLVLGVSG